MTCVTCLREIADAGQTVAPLNPMATTTVDTIMWCRCDNPRPAKSCGQNRLHDPHDDCLGVGFIVSQ